MYFKKKIGVLLLGLMLIFSTAAAAQTLPNPDTSAESACLIDAEDNAVLYGKDENKIMHPASTTKIMTAIIALESGKLDEPLVISSYAVNTEPSSLGLRMGDRITLREALAGMLLVSGNDAAVADAADFDRGGFEYDRFAQSGLAVAGHDDFIVFANTEDCCHRLRPFFLLKLYLLF